MPGKQQSFLMGNKNYSIRCDFLKNLLNAPKNKHLLLFRLDFLFFIDTNAPMKNILQTNSIHPIQYFHPKLDMYCMTPKTKTLK